jgi:hypothetical protein
VACPRFTSTFIHVEGRTELVELRRCETLNHPLAYWARRIATNGANQVCYWCPKCRRAVTAELYNTTGQFVSAKWLWENLGVRAAELPDVRDDLRYRLCSHCRKTRLCEMHHTAMQAAFADADEWPIIPLCDECHPLLTNGYEAYIQRRIAEALRRISPNQAA